MTRQEIDRTVLVVAPAAEYSEYVSRTILHAQATRPEAAITGQRGAIVIDGVLHLQTLRTSQIHGRHTRDTTYAYVGNVGSQTETILLACAGRYEIEARA